LRPRTTASALPNFIRESWGEGVAARAGVSMPRPIAYDVTHLVSRMAARAVTGIDRIDLAYGCHFAAVADKNVTAAFCGAAGPRVMSETTLRKIARQAQIASWEHEPLGADANFTRIKRWLDGGPSNREASRALASPHLGARHRLIAQYWQTHCRVMRSTRSVPRGAIYLNIAEHWLEHPRYFSWLGSRPDVEAVFFVHDLLPLDYPEYFRAGYEAVFRRRFETLAKFGTAFIVSTNVVRERLGEALEAIGRRDMPIHVSPLPSPLDIAGDDAPPVAPPVRPYFLLVSTIEPRKNHLLVLNIWRDLAAELGDDTPRLVLIGSRGWENEQVADMLDRCEGVSRHVLRSARVSRQGLTWLMQHAQALLMPSFDEGYGLPLVEALSLGTPVIASDIATFREVTCGGATLLSPIDGIAWREAILAISQPASPAWQQAKSKIAQFQQPDWTSYFRGVDAFLHALA
jgi:glycosyltransferase involved in cell wall biosynthesis